jgi:phosphoesterase RecJ-like protein
MNIIQKINNRLESARSILVASHKNPEGDALGSSLALYHHFGQGKKIQVFNLDPVPYFLEFLPGSEKIIHQLKDLDPDFEIAVVLDCANLNRVCDDFPQFLKGKSLINIDHHQTASQFGELNLVNPLASSTGEILFQLFFDSERTISRNTATCLYTAISMDTGSFQYPNTTRATLETAASLVKLGAEPARIAHNLYETHPQSRLLLLAQVMPTVKFSENGKRAEMTLTSEMFQKAGAGPAMAEGFINFLTSVKGVEVAILFRELQPGKFKVSFRSLGRIDVARLSEKFGGGGHKQAAGATLEGGLEQIQSLIRREVDEIISRNSG